MPPKNTIELSSGSLYFKGLDEPVPVYGGEVGFEPEWADDKEYIKISHSFEPVTLTCENVEMPRGWTLTECGKCSYRFPITEFYALLYGNRNWLCPLCTLEKRLRERSDNE